MKMNYMMVSSLVVLLSMSFSLRSFAEEAAAGGTTAPAASPAPAPTEQSQTKEGEKKPAGSLDLLQKKYALTDEQVKTLQDSKLPDSQLVKVAELAKESGKSIDEVLKMRTEQKMGWGKIAKELGVHPGRLGKGVAEMRHMKNEERREARKERKEARRENHGHGHGNGNGNGK